MERSTISPEENYALASQVTEIIDGITGGACPTPEEPEEKDVWLLEEGDDSVFYSDEEQAQQDLIHAALPTSMCQRLVNSVADDEAAQQMEEDGIAEKISRAEKEAIQQMIWAEKMQKKLEAQKTGQVITVVAKGTIEFDGSCGEFRLPEQNREAEKVNRQAEEDVTEIQTPDPDVFDAPDIQSHQRLNLGGEVVKPPKLLNKDLEGEQDHEVHAGFHQSHGSGYLTLPLTKKPGSTDPTFNHLSSSKYCTTSYRRIRRGNTRQKIEEFEFIMKNQ